MRNFFPLIAALIIAAGCAQIIDIQDDAVVDTANALQQDVEQGMITVLMEEEMLPVGVVKGMVPEMNIKHIERLFPYGGKFEARLRTEGMHLWYVVTFDKDVPLTKAAVAFDKAIPGVKIIEFVPELRCDEQMPFNDPRLSEQWHYENFAIKEKYNTAADINLFKAWEVVTGDSSVIVAVLDNGAFSEHEDLLENMWTNEAELNGQDGVDDDGNGYVDDIHGFNFVAIYDSDKMVGTIKPNDHGTHTSGTIAAVNNNGIGVSGVAGGNGTRKGVRIMNCQIMPGSAYPQRAFQYAADNGAVIANNSWSSGNSESVNQSIEYFIKYAGLDENGNQVGPMAGGLVVFSAGNDNRTEGWPAMNENVMAVSSVGPSLIKSSFSNFGPWVDITAPGGENNAVNPLGQVLSTSYSNGASTYKVMSGTSMAAPHVSGVAALVVSRFGGPGFTNEMLWDRLISTSDSTTLYSINPGYTDQLGAGLIDAAAAVGADEPNPPMKVSSIVLASNANTIMAKWAIPSSVDGTGKASFFNVYWSAKDLSSLDPSVSLPEGVYTKPVRSGYLFAGDTVSTEVTDLRFGTEYFVRIDASDNANNRSGLSGQYSVVTGPNTPPVIEPVGPDEVTVKKHLSAGLSFRCTDADGHKLTFKLKNAPGVSGKFDKVDGEIINLTIKGLDADAGTYDGILLVSDEYDTVEQHFTYTILPNHAPKPVKIIDDTWMSKNGSVVVDLNDYFTDEDGETLTYSVLTGSVSVILRPVLVGSKLTLNGNYYGMTDVYVGATDASGETAGLKFNALVRDDSSDIDIYPNPVTSFMCVRTVEELNANVSFYSISGAKVIDQDVTTSLFSPARINVEQLEDGVYTVIVKYGNNQIKKNIIKQ